MDTATPAAKPAYTALARSELRLYRLQHFTAMASWDRSTMMPPKGNEARAAAAAELEGVIHRLRTDKDRGDWIRAAQGEPLDVVEQANLREIRREWLLSSVPDELVEKQVIA